MSLAPCRRSIRGSISDAITTVKKRMWQFGYIQHIFTIVSDGIIRRMPLVMSLLEELLPDLGLGFGPGGQQTRRKWGRQALRVASGTRRCQHGDGALERATGR
jgi:hypothetical protein